MSQKVTTVVSQPRKIVIMMIRVLYKRDEPVAAFGHDDREGLELARKRVSATCDEGGRVLVVFQEEI